MYLAVCFTRESASVNEVSSAGYRCPTLRPADLARTGAIGSFWHVRLWSIGDAIGVGIAKLLTPVRWRLSGWSDHQIDAN